MKKLFLLFVVLFATTTLWAGFQVGDLYYNITSDSKPYTVEVTYKSKEIPTSGGYPQFNTDWHIDSVSIPESIYYNGKTYLVTKIGNTAFTNCDSLKYVYIPPTIKLVGGGVFCGCHSLEKVILPENIDNLPHFYHSVGDGWRRYYGFFEDCSSLKQLDIPNNLTSIGERAFCKCSSLTAITIPDSVTEIGGGAFYRCSSLKNITLPEKITSLPSNYDRLGFAYGLFEGCSSLMSITIPNGVKTIGAKTFAECSSITNITLPNTVTTIGGAVFYKCSSLESIVLSENITSLPPLWSSPYDRVGIGFFEGCSSLTSIIVPKNINDIGYLAFYGCKNLVSLQVENGNTTYDSRDNCNAIIETATNSLVVGCSNTTFPSSVTHISDLAFAGNSSLTDITIPNTITSMGGGVFYSCSSLKNVVLSDNITSLSECMISHKSSTSTYSYNFGFFENCSSLSSIIIPDHVIDIGSLTFANCSSLTSITVPNSVTEIGGSVFYKCTALKDVILSKNISSIPTSSFENCQSLTSIVIPVGINRIGSNAFKNCTSLQKTYYDGGIADWCDIYFESLTANPVFKTHNLFIEEKEICKELIIPASVRNISNYAFFGLDSIKFIYCHPSTTPTIYDNTFSNYNALLFVPFSALNDYYNHSWWGEFKKTYAGYGFERDGIYYKTIDNNILSALLLSEEDFNKFIKVSINGSQTWHYSNQYGAKMSGYSDADSRTYSNEDWLISPAMDLSNYSSATLEFEHAFGPKSSIPTTAVQKAQYTCWVSNDFDGDVTTATWRELPITYGTSAWNFISTTVDISEENLKENCHIAWKYVCTNSSATWEIKSVNITGTSIQQVEVISGLSKYSGDIVVPATIMKNDIRYNVVGIGAEAFCNCSSLTSITIPNSVTNMGYSAFRNCSSLAAITIPNGTLSIEDYAFADCSSLNTIIVPNSVIRIGQSAFKSCTSLVEATLSNEVTALEKEIFQDCSSLKSVKLGGKLTTIGEYVFSSCLKLNEISLPASITSISENAFAGCTKLYDVYCYAMEPPTAYESSFANYNAFLHVPCDNQRAYLLDVLFGNFKYIECIEAETATTDTVVVDPSFNDAKFTWPSNNDADTYTLAISKDGEVFCTLTFNANGQLTGIAFAPSRNGQHNAPAAEQAANGFTFTVTGLDEGSVYTYDLFIQDRSGNTLQSYSGEFRTRSVDDRTVMVEYDAAQGQVTGAGTYLVGDTVTLTAIPNDGYRFVRWSNEVEDNPYTFVISDNVTISAEFEAVIPSSLENTNSQSPMSHYQKIIRDGQLLILRDGKTYNVMGAEIQ